MYRLHYSDYRQDAHELIDVAEVARAAARDLTARCSALTVDTAGAALAPLALGDRRYVRERLRGLIREVFDLSSSPAGRTGGALLTVRASTAPGASIAIRVEAGGAWRELRLPVAGAGPLDAPRLAQVARYGFLRLAPTG